MKITIELPDDASPEQIASAIEAAQNAIKPKPDARGYCACGSKADPVILSDWAGGSYCKRCCGDYY
jgi:hypothetical protein